MRGISRSQSAPAPSTWNRGFWALMGIMHAPALAGAWRSCIDTGVTLELLGGCLAITASMLFFVLKFWGVSFLRFRADRRSWLAMLLAVGLIHLNCLRPVFNHADGADYAAIVITVSVVAGVTEVCRTYRKSSVRAKASRRSDSTARFAGTVWLDAWRPHCWVLASYLFRLRAPPA